MDLLQAIITARLNKGTDAKIQAAAGAWLEENLATPSTPPIDSSLTVVNAAADAKATGDMLQKLGTTVDSIIVDRFGNKDDVSNANVKATAGSNILAANKVITKSITAGTKYFIKVSDPFGVISNHSSAAFTLYKWDANDTRSTVASNLFVDRWYCYTAGADVTALSIYIGGSRIANSGTFIFQLVLPDAENNQILAENVESGAYSDNNGAPYRNSSYSRLTKPIICAKGAVITSTTNINVFEYDIVTGEFIVSNGAWSKTYTVQNDSAVLIIWQSAVSNANTFVNTTYVNPTPTVLTDKSIPVNSIEIMAKRYNKQYLHSSTVRSIAHRGDYLRCHGMMCGGSAVVSAKRNGYWATENDVALTSDGKMVMWHDTTLSAIGDPDHSVSDYTLAELKNMDFGSAYGSQFAGEKILTFDEWILLCKQVGINCYIDFKVLGDAFTDALAEEVVTTVRKYGMLKNVTYLHNFAKIRQYHPDARLASLNEPTAQNINSMAPYLAGGEVVFNPSSSVLTAENALLAIENGFGLECWFVDFVNSYTTSQVFAEIERVLALGVQGLSLDIYRVEDLFYYKYGVE